MIDSSQARVGSVAEWRMMASGLLGRDGDAEMRADVKMLHRRRGVSAFNRLWRLLTGCAAVAALTLATLSNLGAADCPKEREPNLPRSGEPASNIFNHKEQLKAYHGPLGATTSAYMEDIKLVIDDAQRYLTERADTVDKPAVVLDIDETSLSNWENLELNDFGFIKKGSCSLRAKHACGFDAWIEQAKATEIGPTLKFYDALRAKKIAVFFVTARPDSQRAATIRNLKRAGFKNWTGLMTRPDDDHGSAQTFKTGQRAKIESDHKNWRYTIIANIGDQESDLKGGHAECPFKLPNPFYLIK
ncbi:HAD family acid phosphatase [Bradyrhizobium japonicum]|uniref:HAD family acid phosphatase n=1 Tax=Bradyrhizobium japonicum TaxID=375 RepID=UPI0009B73350|nr:HAD family acid phosphatase [Bradyrhizobium japonicum]WLB86897.1 HAD family acid phosphatase [Bradyrhizobium japonicum USDA 135]